MKDEQESFISRLSVFVLSPLRDVWLIWLTLAILTTLPYLAAALRTPTGYAFSGVLTAYDDTFSYFAWMRQGADFRLLMCDPFTSEAQSCEFFLPLWNFLGFVARVSGLSIPIAFHVARLLAGLLLLVVARAVAGSVMKSRTRVRYTLWLYAMSAGFGWLVFGLKHRCILFGGIAGSGSADLDLPEAIAFRSFFSQVHFSVGVALVYGAIKLFFTAIVEKRTNHALIAGLLVSLLAVVHPYMVVVVCGVGGMALLTLPWLSNRSKAGRVNYNTIAPAAGGFAIGTFPGVAYLVYLNRSNEVLREWLRVTDTFSPPPMEYAFGFGIVAALAVLGFRLIWNRHHPYGRLLLIWALAQAALLYAPVSIQRRFVEGLQLPLSIAASVALFWIARRSFKGHAAARYREIFLVGAIAFASLTNVGFVIGQIVARGTATGSADPRRYLPADLVVAFDWLRANSEPESVLFSSYLTGNVAPSMTGFRVFLGHYAQTLRSDEKGPLVAAFYTNSMSEEATRKLFAEHRVRYIIYGPFERMISSTFVPPTWLRIAHRAGDVLVFEVTEER